MLDFYGIKPVFWKAFLKAFLRMYSKKTSFSVKTIHWTIVIIKTFINENHIISCNDYLQLDKKNTILIDIRPKHEYKISNIKESINIPAKEIEINKDKYISYSLIFYKI